MSKRVQHTPELEATIRTAVGDPELDTTRFAVYEVSAINTEPLQAGGVFRKARITALGIKEMETFLNKEGGALPLQIMHDTRVLPIGRVVRAKSQARENGELELRAQIMVPLDKADIVSDIDNSIIDEVSIGALWGHAFCSECNFDFFGEESTFENLYTLTCDNGHEIGVDGAHTRLVGLIDWAELSLVGSGAAKNPKILPRVKQTMSKEVIERLAASKVPAEARMLTAVSSLLEQGEIKGENVMDVKDFMTKLEAQSGELAVKAVKLTDTEAALTASKTRITELETKIATLEGAKTTSQTELETRLSKAEGDVKAATDLLAPHIKAALIASGVAEGTVPADLLGQIKLVEDQGLKLHQIITAGGVSSAGKTDLGKTQVDTRKGSFKVS